MKQKIRKAFSDILQKLSPGSASGKVVLLAGGTIVGQGIYVLVTPILSRLYTPYDFGILAVYTALLSILGAFSGLSYHLAIPLPEEESSARDLFVLSLLLNGVLAVVIALVLAAIGTRFLTYFGWDPLIRYKWLLPAGVFATGMYTITTYYALRKEAYSALGATKISQKCLGAVVSIVLGFFEGPVGLIWGQIAGMAGGIVSLLKASIKEPLAVTRKGIGKAALDYRAFPMYQPWGTLLNILSIQIMPLLLFSFFSREITGWFSMSLRVVQLPTVFLGQAIGQVFYQRASLSWRNGTLMDTTHNTVRVLLKVGIFPILWLGTISPVIFPFLFGPEWENAGMYSLFLSPFILLQFLSSPVSTVLLVVNKQRYLLIFQGIMLILGVASLYLGYLAGGIYYPIIIYSIGKMMVYFAYLLIILRFAGVGVSRFLPMFLREIFVAAALLVPVSLSFLFSWGALMPILACLMSGLGYLIYLFLALLSKIGI